MMNDKSEIVTDEKMQLRESTEAITPVQMTRLAVEKNADPDQLLKFMELQERYEAGEARKQYNLAVAEFKSNPVIVTKDKHNTQYDSNYTSIGNLVGTVNAAMSPFGLSARWDIDQASGIKVTCILSHAAGHSESTSMTAPPDDSGRKNPIQQIKSTITYLKVATFEAITGVASSDGNLDDDGNAADQQVERISEEQSLEICGKLTDNDIDLNKFEDKLCRILKCSGFDDIAVDKYQWVHDEIDGIIARRAENE